MHATPYLVVALRGTQATCYWSPTQGEACRQARQLARDDGRAFVFHSTSPTRPGRLVYRTRPKTPPRPQPEG